MFHGELQVETSISIPEILQDLKKSARLGLTDEVEINLNQIVKICNEEYPDRHQFGHAAINRNILLDARITKLLTPDVIKYICSQANSEEKISVISNLRDNDQRVALFDILSYGLSDLLAVKYMINAKKKYTIDDYVNQKKQFDHTTVEIIKNIYFAAGREFPSIAFEQHTSIHSSPLHDVAELPSLLSDIISRVQTLKEGGQTDTLLEFKTYYNNSRTKIREDIEMGFLRACESLGIQSFVRFLPVSLESFCDDFLRDEKNIILNGSISSLFHDRMHILGALELDSKITFLDGEYTFQQLFEKMAQLLSSSSSNYPPSTLEQFYVRLTIVKNDLIKRFGQNPQEYVEKMKTAKMSFPSIEVCEMPTITLTESDGVSDGVKDNKISPFSNNPYTTFNHYDNTQDKKFLFEIAQKYNERYKNRAFHIVIKIKNYRQ